MGRPRGFEVEGVLDRAADLFRRHGYEGTSMEDLVTHLGVHRGSLYSVFGSKQGLYLQALDRYWARSVAPWHCALAGLASWSGPILPSLERLLSAAVVGSHGHEGKDDPDLALLVRAGSEQGSADVAVRLRLERWLGDLTEAVAGALRRAADLQELRPGVDPEALAGPLLAAVLGLHLYVRASQTLLLQASEEGPRALLALIRSDLHTDTSSRRT